MAHKDVDETREGRIVENATFGDLTFEHGEVIVVHGVANGLMIRLVSLDNDGATGGVTTGATGDLGDLLEGTFVGAEIGIGYEVVGRKDADDGDIVKIEALGDHLSADEDVGATVFEVVEDFEVAVFAGGGVEIHTGDACVGEEDGEVVLDAFGAETAHFDLRRVAGGANGRDGDGIAAIVAAEGCGSFVVDKRHITVDALGDVVADVAFKAGREPSAVLEKDDLLLE